MPEDKQWFWTKLVGGVLSLLLVISIVVGMANMHFNLQRDVRGNEEDIAKNTADIEGLSDDVIALEKSQIERIAEYRALSEKMDRHERTQQLILTEMKRLERAE